MKKLLTMTAVGAIMLTSANAQASGFFIREQSISGMGNAFAGATAGAEDISYSFWNPAGLTRHEGMQVNANVTMLYSTLEAESRNAPYNKEDEVIPFAVIPSGYASYQFNDKLTAGFSVTAPFGLKTDYENDFSNLVAGDQDTLSDLKTYNFATSLAYKLTDKLSLGAGLNIQRIEAELRSSINAGAALQNLEGDATDAGYTLGALYEFNEGTRVGVGYRSEIDHELEGEGSGAYNGGIAAKVTTPEMLTFGVYHDVDDSWAIMAEAQRTGWSSFKTLDILMTSGPGAGTSLNKVDEEWNDVWFYSIGANYKYSDKTKFRFGVAYDDNPVDDYYRTMRIPDSDRVWLSTGLEYKIDDKMTFNAGYTFIFADSHKIDYKEDGTNKVSYDGNIHLLGLGLNYKF